MPENLLQCNRKINCAVKDKVYTYPNSFCQRPILNHQRLFPRVNAACYTYTSIHFVHTRIVNKGYCVMCDVYKNSFPSEQEFRSICNLMLLFSRSNVGINICFNNCWTYTIIWIKQGFQTTFINNSQQMFTDLLDILYRVGAKVRNFFHGDTIF